MDNKKIGLLLKKLREEKKLSQESLAYELYVDRSIISRIENGKIPATDILYSYSRYFNVSTDEILSGELKNNENEEEINKIGFKIFEEKNRLITKIRCSLFLLVFILLLFFMYFFFTFYNSVSTYSIAVDSNEINIQNGFFVKTREKVYFQLNNICLKDENEIDFIEIYYEIGKEKKIILKTDEYLSISFDDYYGYEEYLQFNAIDEIIKNMYLSITLKNKDIVTSKLEFCKDYSNNSFFLNKDLNISSVSNKNNKNEYYDNSELFYKFEKLRSASNNHYIVSLNKKIYEVFVLDDLISITFDDKEFVLNFLNDCIFENRTYNDSKVVEEYTFNYSKNKCLDGDCLTYENDISLLSKILEKIDL